MALALTTIVGRTVVTTVVGNLVRIGILAMNVTVVMTVILEMIAMAGTTGMLPGKNAVAGTNVLHTLANAPDPPLAARILMIVAPGRLPLRGNLMIGGLQGTMIDEDRMMFGEALTLILIVAGTNVDVTRRTTASTRGRRGPTEIAVGDAE